MTHVRKLGAGCFGYADLYKDRRGNYFVLKTQKVLESYLTRDTKSKKLKFRPDCRFRAEIMFFAWVAKLPNKHKKYFMQLLGTSIEKGAKFDSSCLCDCDGNEFKELAASPYVYTSKLTLAGEEIGQYIERYIEEYYDKGELPKNNLVMQFIRDAQLIVRLANKAGFFIKDLHSGNLCWNGDNCVLIDYGEIKIAAEIKDARLLRKWQFKEDKLCILEIAEAFGYIYKKIAEQFQFRHPILQLKLLTQATVWPQITEMLRLIFAGTDVDITRILADVSNGIYSISDVRDIVDMADTLFAAIDPDNYNLMWQSAELYPVTRGASIYVPQLVSNEVRAELLADFVNRPAK
jgi:hypothetical protein